MRRARGNRRKERILKILGLVSFVFIIGITVYPFVFPSHYDAEQSDAIEFMEEMISSVSQQCKKLNIDIDHYVDPDLSGLIGLEWTEITSTIGHLDAKRTSIQPEMAAVLVTLLKEARVQTGDTIGLACSGSFPGLMLAGLSAIKAMNLHCKAILSLGSSSFGANRLELTILDIYLLLRDKELIKESIVGVSLGGEKDCGEGWDSEIIGQLNQKIEQSGYPFIREEKLVNSVERRVDLMGINDEGIKLLINAGGAMANIGTSEFILGVKPGLVSKMKIPPVDQQGLIHKAWENKVQVIHLLYLKGLALEYGVKWDRAGSLYAE